MCAIQCNVSRSTINILPHKVKIMAKFYFMPKATLILNRYDVTVGK